MRASCKITRPPSLPLTATQLPRLVRTLLKELRLTRLRKAAGKIGNRMKSAAVFDAHTKKLDKYALLDLEAIVERQLISGLRSRALRILPVAISTHGEFCTGAVELQDWLTDKFERRLENELQGSRDDGQKRQN
jgi:hypothetical protein